MLIARLIADPAGLEMRLNAASRALAERGAPLAGAQMLDFCGDVLELSLPGDDVAVLREVIDAHFA
ncbi:MAG: phosphoserine phosphatase SerB, partial [Sphingomonadales bacterium]